MVFEVGLESRQLTDYDRGKENSKGIETHIGYMWEISNNVS